MTGAALPSGTVTFLFTDIEGSTRLLEEIGPEGYAVALADHRTILRKAFAAHGGVEVDTQGDAFFVAFATADDAVGTATDARSGLEGGPIRIRAGIHTGTPLLTDGGYVGLDVNRAARIAAAGTGGQVLVSATTAALVDGRQLHDLGEHRLKDLSAPQHIFQLGTTEFPPLKTLYRTNLPVPSTHFIGRERELVAISALLSGARVLTLTGPGGTGKTRLALQAAARSSGDYPDGVWWVPLAALRDPSLVLLAAGEAMGAQDELATFIGSKRLLLLFDNFEHVADAATGLADLVETCPGVTLLVTSRERLHLAAEHEYPVPPFDPDEGVRFFVARARMFEPDFAADGTVAQICRRLDDLPLALELAAARVKALTAGQILERLDDRLPLLTGGARDLPERQRTLRATIAWSYELLSESERKLFAALAIFSGGCTLEAAEAICGADLDDLQSLVDKSLVRHTGERFWMLETIREYSDGLLREAGGESALQRAHAEYFTRFAEEAGSRIEAAGEAEARARLSPDYANLRKALEWAAALEEHELLLRLAAALGAYWQTLGTLAEGRRWILLALGRAHSPVPARLKALRMAAYFVVADGDLKQAEAFGEEALTLAESTSNAYERMRAINALGRVAMAADDLDRAATLCLQAKEAAAELGDEWMEAAITANLGAIAIVAGDCAAGLELSTEALELNRRIASEDGIARALENIGWAALGLGDPALARDSFEEALVLGGQDGSLEGIAASALGLAAVAARDADAEHVARLLGAADTLHAQLGGGMRDSFEAGIYERATAEARAALGEAGFAAAWESGHALEADEIVRYALRRE